MKEEKTNQPKRKAQKENLKILKEASKHGVRENLEKYGVYPATYYAWKQKFKEMGEEGFTHGITKQRLQRIKELELKGRPS